MGTDTATIALQLNQRGALPVDVYPGNSFEEILHLCDKPASAVVGSQPFGGSRASGTNDKAGSPLNLERWVTPRTIKESFCPPTDYRYRFMGEPQRNRSLLNAHPVRNMSLLSLPV